MAYQLDLMDNTVLFVIGFPAIVVFALWTFDRRRKEKQSQGKVESHLAAGAGHLRQYGRLS
jgi:hypothetical protein